MSWDELGWRWASAAERWGWHWGERPNLGGKMVEGGKRKREKWDEKGRRTSRRDKRRGEVEGRSGGGSAEMRMRDGVRGGDEERGRGELEMGREE